MIVYVTFENLYPDADGKGMRDVYTSEDDAKAAVALMYYGGSYKKATLK